MQLCDMIKKNKIYPMFRKRTYRILLSEEGKKDLYVTIHSKKLVKLQYGAAILLFELNENAPRHPMQVQLAKNFRCQQVNSVKC